MSENNRKLLHKLTLDFSCNENCKDSDTSSDSSIKYFTTYLALWLALSVISAIIVIISQLFCYCDRKHFYVVLKLTNLFSAKGKINEYNLCHHISEITSVNLNKDIIERCDDHGYLLPLETFIKYFQSIQLWTNCSQKYPGKMHKTEKMAFTHPIVLLLSPFSHRHQTEVFFCFQLNKDNVTS